MLKRSSLFIVLCALVLFPVRPEAFAQSLCGCSVLRVVDGDTIVVLCPGGKKEKVRLLNVDTPESVHPDKKRNTPLGKAASNYARSRLAGRSVCLEFEGSKRGKYGRLLAYVILDHKNFNLELVREGWSSYYTKYGESRSWDNQFRAAQSRAKAGGLGIWKEAPRSGNALAAVNGANGPFRGNRKSRVFHSSHCKWYQCKSCTRVFLSKKEAQDAGYHPCHICMPR